MTNNPTVAVAYVRVSTIEQLAGVSLDAQEERIRLYCELQNIPLLRVYRDEGVSGGKKLADRPQGAALLDVLTHDDVGHVVALKLDRLFRDAVDCLQTASDFDRRGVALHFIDLGGQAVNTASAMGRFFLTVIAGAAELERNVISERTSMALQHLKANGRKLGAPALGLAGDTAAAEVETVRLILRMRGAPEPSTFRAIADELRRAGAKTKRGGEWYPSTVRAVWLRRAEYKRVLSAVTA